MNMKEISELLQVKHSTVHGIIKKYRETGVIAATVRAPPNTKKLNGQVIASIKEWIDQDCSQTFKQLTIRIREQYNILVSTTTVARVIKGFHYSFKKVHKVALPAVHPGLIADRKEYAERFLQLPDQYADDAIVFIDEKSFQAIFRVSYGRKSDGERAVNSSSSHPVGSRNFSILCAMTRNGIIHYEHRTAAKNVPSFIEFLRELFVKITDIGSCILIMDDIPYHQSGEVRTVIEEEGHPFMLLPSNTPFFNPIEIMFSNWKSIVKRAEPTNEKQLMNAIAEASNLVTRQDTEGFVHQMWTNIRRCTNGEGMF
ncbi:uncharacterized protein LOC131259558 isoform X1 [Anopheles coustani]|uniref:uncharacterized protein LOC131259558 isoform X1 n=1 Tax=Anopheles coustani TaxID=139045 RepID=UPI00265804FF|nr:uncharacterized protein LOC131259558 isoform X1 [Anopheles coustani]